MRTSSLFEKQKELGAEFIDLDGWKVVRRFSSVAAECAAGRRAVALMERPYLGLVELSGKDHVDLLHRLSTNEVRHLQTGEGQINLFTNEKGRLVERVVLLKFDDRVWLHADPHHGERLSAWLERFIFIEDVQVRNLSDLFTTLTLFGPNAAALIQAGFGEAVHDLAAHQHVCADFEGSSITLVASPELNRPGFDLLVPTETAGAVWDRLFEAGKEFGLQPLGEEAYEALRIEAGWPRPGRDFDDRVNPHEAQLLAYVNFDKGCYVGQEVIARLDTYEKVQKYLMQVRFAEASPLPEPGDAVLMNGDEVGWLTSVTRLPDADEGVALAYVRAKFAEPERSVEIRARAGNISGTLKTLPYLRQST